MTIRNLGIENRNPINLRYSSQISYVGMHPCMPNVKGFYRFTTFDYGLRAAVLAIRRLAQSYPPITIAQLIRCLIYLPQGKFLLYVACICGRAGLGPMDRVEPFGPQISKIVSSLAKQETGIHVTPEYIDNLRRQFGV